MNWLQWTLTATGILSGVATLLKVLQLLWWVHCRLRILDDIIDEHQKRK
jgi:hypothetical protein